LKADALGTLIEKFLDGGINLKTDYLWKTILTPAGLTDILEHYAQIVESKDWKTGKVKREQVFPRYHQLDVVRKLLANAGDYGAGKRYLIEHSPGSGGRTPSRGWPTSSSASPGTARRSSTPSSW
jgi:type I site-specific restriction-modification system R (restriction) subunit